MKRYKSVKELRVTWKYTEDICYTLWHTYAQSQPAVSHPTGHLEDSQSRVTMWLSEARHRQNRMSAVRVGLESALQKSRRLDRVQAVCSFFKWNGRGSVQKTEWKVKIKGQTFVGSAYGNTNNTVSCHHIVKHDVLLEKENRRNHEILYSHDPLVWLQLCFYLGFVWCEARGSRWAFMLPWVSVSDLIRAGFMLGLYCYTFFMITVKYVFARGKPCQ